MLSTIKQYLGKREDEKGFTLIELMVVLLIIAILLAIAIPTFLGARNTANSRAAQADLNTALTAEQTYYANNQSFTANVTSAGVAGIEPNLAWTSTSPVTDQSPNAVLPTLVDSDAVTLTIVGKDHNCYEVAQYNQPQGATPVTSGTYYDQFAATAGTGDYTCTPAAGPTAQPAAGSSAHANPGTWSLGW